MTRFFVLTFALVLTLSGAPIAHGAATSADVNNRRAQLEAELAQLEREISEQAVILQGKQKERVSLERDVAILDAQIEKAKLSIRARDLTIRTLTNDIGTKADTIVALDEKLIREKQSLAELLRKRKEIDDATVMEVMLSAGSVSTFFEDIDDFTAIQERLKDSFVVIADTKTSTTEEKTRLEERKAEEQQLRQLQVFEQNVQTF